MDFAAIVKLGYMLENLSIWHYETLTSVRKNVSSAGNQQETRNGILRDHTPSIRVNTR
jgi:hypothetical protein